MKFYWIDALDEYEIKISEGVKKAFKNIYIPLAREYGFEFEYVDASKICVISSDRDYLLYNGSNILQTDAYAYISYTNANSQMDKTLESIARIAMLNKKWRIVNSTNKGVFFDKDKFYCMSIARDIGVPTLPTAIITPGKAGKTLIPELEKTLGSYPYIIKPKEFLAGIGIFKVENRESLSAAMDIISGSNRDYIAQSFVADASDYRVYTENGRIIACLKRTPARGNYLASISQTGTGQQTEIPDGIREFSVKISEELADGYLCIDWLSNHRQFWFSEIESGGGFTVLPDDIRAKVARSFFCSKKRWDAE